MSDNHIVTVVVALIAVIGAAAIALFKDELGYVILICIIILVSIIALYFYSKTEGLKAEIEDKSGRWKEQQYEDVVWIIGRKSVVLRPIRAGDRDDVAYITLDALSRVVVTTAISGRGPDKVIEGYPTRRENFRRVDVPRNCEVKYTLTSKSRLINRVSVSVWLLNGNSPPALIAVR